MNSDMDQDISAPVVLYKEKAEVQVEEIPGLYSRLKEKSPGIRVFYYNPGDHRCDHSKQHNQSWKSQLEDGSSLEAGTVIALTDFKTAGARQQWPFVIIQWDCGLIKAYSKAELEEIRVFDLGPAG